MFDIEKIKGLFKTETGKAYFWSGLGANGADIAAFIAKQNDGTTLEMLMEKNKDALIDAGFPFDTDTQSFLLDPSDIQNKKAWSDLSALYATQASGNVHIVAGTNVYEGSVWRTAEMPILINSSNVTSINGISINNIRNAYNDLGGIDNPDAVKYIGETIESVPCSNKNENIVFSADDTYTNSTSDNLDNKQETSNETNKKQDGSETSGEETGKNNDGDFEEKSIKEKEGSSEGDSTKKTEDADSSESGKKEPKETDTDAIKKEEKSSGKEDISGDKDAETTRTEEKHSTDHSSDADGTSKTEEKVNTDTNTNEVDGTKPKENVAHDNVSDVEGSVETHKDTSTNTEKVKETGDISAKEHNKTNTDVTESHSSNDYTSSNTHKESSGGGTDKGSSQNHDSHTSDTSTPNEHNNVDNSEHTKTESTGNHSDYDKTAHSEGNTDTHTKTDINDMSGSESKVHDVDADIDGHNVDKPHTDIDINDGKTKINPDYKDLDLSDDSMKVINALEEGSEGKIGKVINNSKTAAKFNKIMKVVDEVGDLADVVDAAYNIGKAIKQFKDGDVDGAGKTLRDYGFTTLGGMIAIPVGAFLAWAGVGIIPLLIITGLAGWTGSEIGDFLSDIFDEIFGLYNEAGTYTYPVDPLIFDLNGDGVKTVSLADGVHFDFDKNGFAEKIGWVSADDGLLVRDLNNDGKISSGRELMGDLTELSEDMVASNGFQALAYYDSNGDGLINSSDSIYNELKIWQDKNQNGVVDDGEIMSLRQTGIDSINLVYDNIDITDENGNGHSQKGSYTRTDGTTMDVEDVWFAKDAADTVLSVENNEQYILEETDEVRNLPDLQGKGNQYSLHQAMLRDESGRLQELVEQYVAEEDVYNRKKMLPDLIYAWTGVLDEDKFGRGEYLSDARKLEALEVITGRDFTSAYGANPVEGAVDFIENAFDRLIDGKENDTYIFHPGDCRLENVYIMKAA